MYIRRTPGWSYILWSGRMHVCVTAHIHGYLRLTGMCVCVCACMHAPALCWCTRQSVKNVLLEKLERRCHLSLYHHNTTNFTFLFHFGLHVFESISLDQWQLFICIIICSGLKRKLTPKFHGSPNCNNQCFITYAKQNLSSHMKFLVDFLLLRKLKMCLLNRSKIFPSSL